MHHGSWPALGLSGELVVKTFIGVLLLPLISCSTDVLLCSERARIMFLEGCFWGHSSGEVGCRGSNLYGNFFFFLATVSFLFCAQRSLLASSLRELYEGTRDKTQVGSMQRNVLPTAISLWP